MTPSAFKLLSCKPNFQYNVVLLRGIKKTEIHFSVILVCDCASNNHKKKEIAFSLDWYWMLGNVMVVFFLCSVQVTLPMCRSNYALQSNDGQTFEEKRRECCAFFLAVLTMNPARLSNLCWKSFHSSSPFTLPAFSALNICSSVSGCKDASATFSTGSILSKASLSGKLTRHISRYT